MNRRLALIQALVSLIALAAVVWWAAKQESPKFPSGGDAIAWLAAASVLYAVATILRGERWHWILAATGVRTRRSDCYALTTVGYMGNNVLPARAGEALKVVLLAGRCGSSKRTLLGSVVAERILDLVAL
ncbi:MAG: glycosyltransferase 2 family protein, partial [Thermoleophilaceae bacterium]|nr:glycosyltransferase 2 family protein [Thermoleophilaceae bacterium]